MWRIRSAIRSRSVKGYAWCGDCREFRPADEVSTLSGKRVRHLLRKHRVKWWQRKLCPGSGKVSIL